VNPLDKAGAYGIQKGRELIIDRVEGSIENVMGLPTQKLENTLQKLKFNFRS
jgi:septum formation protein